MHYINSIAIDGPAGAGKSTIAKNVSKSLGFIYVDTGAMYRAMALYLVRSGADIHSPESVTGKCENADISIEYRDGEQVVLLNGENVNPYLRTEEVSEAASVTSAVPRVREKLVELQRRLAASKPAVMDGRDIGTVVLPNAVLKVFLTASVEVRTKRRTAELIARGEKADVDAIRQEIIERDKRDSTRAVSPLKKADDAVEVDTSDLSIDEVTEKILGLYDEAKKIERFE